MTDLDIGEVARRTGLPVSTLRYYEEKGLIAATGRHGLRRRFAPDVVERLALITLGRTAGFSLAEMARVFPPAGHPHIDRRMLTAKAEELDETIGRLTALRDGLRHAAACPAPTHLECPSFQAFLQSAASGTRKPSRRTPPQRRS